MKKRLCFIGVFMFSLFINLLLLRIFKNNIGFANVSYIAIVVFIAMCFHGIVCYIFRYKGNFLSRDQSKQASSPLIVPIRLPRNIKRNSFGSFLSFGL